MLCAASCIQGSSIHGNKPVAELLHHHVEWDGVARSVNDDHEGFDSELCVEIIGIYLAHQDLMVGLAHGDCDGSCGHVSIEHQLVLTGLRISRISVPLKYLLFPVIIGRYRSGTPWDSLFSQPQTQISS